MGKPPRLSSAALHRFQAHLVAQLRAHNAKLRIEDRSLAISGDTSSSSSVSVNFECCDGESDDSVNQVLQVETSSKNSLSSATLRRIQAQIVAHLRACNAKLGLRPEVEADQPRRLGASVAAADLRSTEMFDPENNWCNNQFLESTSSSAAEYRDVFSKSCTSGVRGACYSTKRRNSSLYSVDIRPVCENATVDFTRPKKRFRNFRAGEERDERRGSEIAHTASDGYSYVLDGRLSGQMRDQIKLFQVDLHWNEWNDEDAASDSESCRSTGSSDCGENFFRCMVAV
ncbi:hypothetical protein O6H91_Y194700 [Diphasiastrum complanatum]|nr:hypothetical protein O6H91_Y194700 [Diphasiastrum complanatum]